MKHSKHLEDDPRYFRDLAHGIPSEKLPLYPKGEVCDMHGLASYRTQTDNDTEFY